MSSHTATIRMTPDLIAEACKKTTSRLREYEAGAHLAPDSLAIVFSGCVGAFLWAYALKKGCADSHLIEFVNQHVGFINSASRSLAPVPIHAVIYGARHEQRIPILFSLFHSFDDEQSETTANPQKPLNIWVKHRDHANLVPVPCSVSFHDPTRPIAASTRVSVRHDGGVMEVATANPGQLLFEALKDIKEKQDETMPDDYALFFDVPSSYPSIDSVVLLAKVAEAVLEHAQGSPNVKRGFPLTELKIRSDLRKLRTSKEDYDVIQKWLLEVDRALTEKSQQLRMHKGSVEMHRKQVMYRQPAFHYLRPFFPPLREHDLDPVLFNDTQSEDTFQFPAWPSSPHAASSR